MGLFQNLVQKKPVTNLSGKVTSIEERWSEIKGEYNGHPMLVKKNVWCDQIAGNTHYPLNCGIAFQLKYSGEDGFPLMEKEPDLVNLEKDLFKLFQSDLNSVVTIIITTSGFREYVLYTQDLERFEKSITTLKEKYKQYYLKVYYITDEEWATYKSFN